MPNQNWSQIVRSAFYHACALRSALGEIFFRNRIRQETGKSGRTKIQKCGLARSGIYCFSILLAIAAVHFAGTREKRNLETLCAKWDSPVIGRGDFFFLAKHDNENMAAMNKCCLGRKQFTCSSTFPQMSPCTMLFNFDYRVGNCHLHGEGTQFGYRVP